MNPYLFTLSFLLMMSLLTSSQVAQFSQTVVEREVYAKSRQAFVAKEVKREMAHLEEFRDQESDTEPKPRPKPIAPSEKPSSDHCAPLRFNTARPPNNSRLNFYILLHQAPIKEISWYEVAASLMRQLYQEEPFFQKVPNAEYRLLDKLIEKKEQTLHFQTPDELSSLHLDDPELQAIFYKMLKGTKNTRSLLHFITFDQGKGPLMGQRVKINLMFADPLLLHAIFQNRDLAQKIIALRDRILKKMIYQEAHRLELTKDEGKNRTQYKEGLIADFEQILESTSIDIKAYEKYVFDFGLGDPGKVLFIPDPLTGELTREKYKSHVQQRVKSN